MLSTYNVLEAATRLGIRKVIFASSETTYGVCFAQGERGRSTSRSTRSTRRCPEDSYAMSKVANEVTARSFQARTGADIYGLRINNVIEPHEYAEMFPPFLADPACGGATSSPTSTCATSARWCSAAWRPTAWATRSSTSPTPTCRSRRPPTRSSSEFYDGVEVRREMGRDETFYAIDKARELVGFDPQHSWRDVLDDPRLNPSGHRAGVEHGA